MWTDEQRETLISLKAVDTEWKTIALAVSKGVETCRTEWKKIRKLAYLPPKTRVSKKITNGRVGLSIKNLVEQNPKIPYRDIPAAVKSSGVGTAKVPSATTCQRFFKENSMKVVRLL
jgi:hypothetical protein